MSQPPSTAFFLADPHAPDRFTPTMATIGPWSPEHQHGGPPIALLARALTRFPAKAPMDLGRLTVEILNPVPLAPCEVTVQVLRPGKRVELLQAQYRVDGRVVLTAQAWRLQREPGICPVVPDDFMAPPLPPAQPRRFFQGVSSFPYGESLEWRFVTGAFDELGPATVWARPLIPLVEGEIPSGVENLLVMLDSANGVSGALPFPNWSFVPVDLTLNLHRLPQGPWLGMDARTVIDPGGIGTVHTTVFDASGSVGRSLHTLFVRPKVAAA